MSGSESPVTTNSFIERQKAALKAFEEGQVAPPDPAITQPPAPADPQPPAPQAAPPEPPAAPQPPAPAAPPADDVQARLQELEHRYNSLHGRLEPTQQALAAAQRRIEELERERQAAPQPPDPPEPDDPALAEFEAIYGDMTPGLTKFVQKKILDPLLKPLRPALEAAQQTASDADVLANRRKFLAPVVEKHPNAGQIIESAEFKAYLDSMPSYVRDTIADMLMVPERTGDPMRIMQIFDDYVARGAVQPPAAPPPPAPPAPAAVPGTMAVVPRTVPTAPAPSAAAQLPQPLTKERLAVIRATLTGRYGPVSDEQRTALMLEMEQGHAVALQLGRGAQVTDTLR